MSTLTIPNTFTSNTVIASALMNANFTAIATLINSTGLTDANIASGAAISRAKIASGTASSVVLNDSSGNLTSATILTVPNGGTGVASIGTNTIPYGQGTSAVAVAAAGTQYQSLQAGAAGVPAFAAVALGQSAAVSGQLAIANGGTGQATKAAAYAALSPMTTKGDLEVYDTSTNRLAVGTDGYVLTASSAASPGVAWQAVPAATSQSLELVNLGLATSISSSALTVSLKQLDGATDPSTGTAAVKIAMRSSTATSGKYNERSVTAALSQTISSTTTLGMLASQNNNLWVYAIDSDGAGTMKLGMSTVKYDELSLQNAVAESFTGTVTLASPGVWTANGHGLNNTDAVTLTTTGALPTGLSVGTTYYVVSSATNTFDLAATPGGTAINTSVSQSGTHTIHVACARLVSSGTYSLMPIRLIGRSVYSLAAAGTWIAPAELTPMTAYAGFPESVNCRYTVPSGSISNGSYNIVKFGTRTFDTHNAYNASTGEYIVPRAGKYMLSSTLACTFSPAALESEALLVVARKNDATTLTSAVPGIATGSGEYCCGVTDFFSCVAGDTLSVYMATVGTAQSYTSTSTSAIMITRIGD